MNNSIDIGLQDFSHHLKLSCKIPKIIEEIANCKIIELASKEVGITVEIEELQEAADNFRIDNQLHNTETTWSWLNQHYLSLDDFEALVYANALAKKLAQHLFEDKVEPWFYENQLDYGSAVLYEVILEEADLAMELFCGLQEREFSFQEIARQYIQDLSLRRRGGYLGSVRRRELQPEISAAVFDSAVSAPQIIKPIPTHRGNHLILVEEIIQPQLDEELRAQIIEDLFFNWLQEKRKQLQINTDFQGSLVETNKNFMGIHGGSGLNTLPLKAFKRSMPKIANIFTGQGF